MIKSREKSDKSKLSENRGVLVGDTYEAWKRANEAKSTGTASMIFDPISGRSVSVLSKAEKKVYWLLRFSPDVDEIFDQVRLDKKIIDSICEEIGIRKYTKILSTDILVKKKDGSFVALSVKANRSCFNESRKGYIKLINRQLVEKRYWEKQGVPFSIVFGDDVDDIVVSNIADVMRYWNIAMAIDDIGKVKYLIAHRLIVVPMNGRIPFKKLAFEINLKEVFDEIDNKRR